MTKRDVNPPIDVDLEILGLEYGWRLNAVGMNWSYKEPSRCPLMLVEASNDDLKESIAVAIGFVTASRVD